LLPASSLPRALLPVPTRRSSDLSFSSSPHEFPGSYIGAFIPPLTGHLTLQAKAFLADMARYERGKPASVFAGWGYMEAQVAVAGDRKSTRLNSSHQIISYAVFCL